MIEEACPMYKDAKISVSTATDNMKSSFTKKQFLFLVIITVIFCYLVYYYYFRNYAVMENCIFCSIIAGHTNTTIEVETDDYVIFEDIKPASTYHYLAVPKLHIESLQTMSTNDHLLIIDKLESAMRNFFNSRRIEGEIRMGFHMPPFITVKHLHLHGIAPVSNMTAYMRMIFKPETFWFKTVNEAKSVILSHRNN